MQLSDVLKDTCPIEEAHKEMKFQMYLKKLSKLPERKKREIEEEIKKKDFTFADLVRIFKCD